MGYHIYSLTEEIVLKCVFAFRTLVPFLFQTYGAYNRIRESPLQAEGGGAPPMGSKRSLFEAFPSFHHSA